MTMTFEVTNMAETFLGVVTVEGSGASKAEWLTARENAAAVASNAFEGYLAPSCCRWLRDVTTDVGIVRSFNR